LINRGLNIRLWTRQGLNQAKEHEQDELSFRRVRNVGFVCLPRSLDSCNGPDAVLDGAVPDCNWFSGAGPGQGAENLTGAQPQSAAAIASDAYSGKVGAKGAGHQERTEPELKPHTCKDQEGEYVAS